MRFERAPTDHQWAAQRVEALPPRWRRRILRNWERNRAHRAHDHWTAEQEAHRAANLALLHVTEQLGAVRLPLDATDSEITTRAAELAARCWDIAALYRASDMQRAAMARVCEANHVTPPPDKTEDGPACARMVDPLWWRRALRKLHAKSVEGAAIGLGYVNRAADCYVSGESLQRRQQQNARNAATLEGTIARNELGQEYTLAELAAKGTANKAIRRAELMTRISGFERIARDMGHAGLFFTITCPSRMHKWRTVNGGRVIENPRYDGTLPNEAQRYLAKVWARIRAKLGRDEVGLYGFRIAEPNHDGTPHWHLLVFHESGQYQTLREVVTRYALKDSPNEPGADRHRVDFKPIDWERGTAAGYIAKYVAKNIDGYKLGEDLYGNPALETSARVEAWAATWGIRQFQQIGGAPVGVWRELRRVESVPEQAPDHLKAAHRAVNKLAEIEGRENACVAWDHYTKAQGGVFCGRGYRVRIAYQDNEGQTGRYGEQKAPSPVGVETVSREIYTPAHMAWMGGKAERLVHWFVESSRYVWEIVTRKARGAFEGFKSALCAPWTCVNNCTEGGSNECSAEAGNGDKQAAGDPGSGPEYLGQGPGACSGNGGGVCHPTTGGAGGHRRGA